MTRSARLWRPLSIGLTLLAISTARGQTAPPVTADLPALFERLAERARALSEDVKRTLGSTREGRALSQDAQELVQAITDFQATIPKAMELFALRQRYAGIDSTWHRLQAELGRAEVASPDVERSAARLSEVDAQIHKALGLNVYPARYFGPGPALTGPAELQRLTQALVHRADALADVIGADLGGQPGQLAVRGAISLARVADNFHDAIELTSSNIILRNDFAIVSAQSKTLGEELSRIAVTPRVQNAWRAYKAAEVLVRQGLGIRNSPEDLTGTAIPANGPPPFINLSTQLLTQIDAFLQGFTPIAGTIAEGAAIVADAERLRAAALVFREDAARGLDVGQLAFRYRDVDFYWQRLVRRANRHIRGGTALNLRQLGEIGATCTEIHQMLGIPGYPPIIAQPTAPG